MLRKNGQAVKSAAAIGLLFGASAVSVLPPGNSVAHAEEAAQHSTQRGPESVADLAESLIDAVVNIAITQTSKTDADGGFPSPNFPEDAPFQDLFDDYFKNPDANKAPRKVSSLGSGFVIDPAGYIVTNNHVIEGATEIEVNFADGSKLDAKLVGTDTKTDLALLKVEPKKPLKAVAFGDSRKMRIGDWVMAIGNPFGLGGSVSVGIISARNRNINAGPYDNFIQTDAAINRGNSGGPLFNMFGEVIGINTAIISPTGGSIGIGFAVPTEIATTVVSQLREFGETRRGWLGVRIQPVTEDIFADLKLDRPRGALISGIITGGPVDNGSMEIGDVVLQFNGENINEMRDLPRIVAESPIDKPLKAVLLRKGKEITIDVTLKRQPEEEKDKPAATSDDPSAKPPVVENAPETGKDGTETDPGPDEQALPPQPSDLLGLTLETLTAENRKAFGIPETVEGVLVADVPVGSPAQEKGIVKGDVIVEIAQDFVESPDDVADKIAELKSADRRNAYLMLADKTGALRLVAIPLD
ncbi:Do family serine endopeptidase [Rhizobium alvei]|uniref:Probable periplasmic serine endoprotease DegP-like n=1 Tax=Rhizobium alvei TaxID=1132659 RepID=A0ABT8YIB5_9HYPH|nr:Do family serine endopeptidase [Rhizobium alvei]MDO6963439.1 Do family serine endopeptidase [Rhizobium alvei]